MNKHIDTALVERAVVGQEQAIQRVLLEMQDLAWALGRDFAADSDQAQDLAQEILMEIARSLPRLREPEHAISWCYTLGKTEAVDCVLHPVVDDVCRQVIEQVGLSSAKGVAELLEHNGYGHLCEQFPVLALSHASSLTNHCFAALVEMGALGEVPSERSAAWGCWMWKGDVRLGRWEFA